MYILMTNFFLFFFLSCRQTGVALSAPSLKLMQNIFPSSVQYNTTVSGSNRLKEGILLVDDDRQRLEKTQSLLRQHFIVYSVNNDDEALDFLDHSIKNVNNDNEVCLIIISLDVIGDHINGWGFLNMLWSSEELKDIPVIALASSLSLKLNKSKIWEVRLVFIMWQIVFFCLLHALAYLLILILHCRRDFQTLKNDRNKLYTIPLMLKHMRQTGRLVAIHTLFLLRKLVNYYVLLCVVLQILF